MAAQSVSGLPRVVDGHRLLEEIGAGRWGVVYLADRDGRQLALKILRSGVAVDRRVLERFLWNAPNRIRHPNLVPLLAVGDTEGSTYYVMRLFRGDFLNDMVADLRRGSSRRPSLSPLSIGPDGEVHPEFLPHAVRLVTELAEGLEEAHKEGIAHLRISPRNLVCSPTGRLVVTDFGVQSGQLESIQHEEAGPFAERALETIPYLAPEQHSSPALGSVSSDVYALGALLYEVLTLEPPVEGSAVALMRKATLKGRIRPLREHRPDVPVALEDIVLKALTLDPDSRYASAGKLAADLRRFQAGEAVEATTSRISTGRRGSTSGRWRYAAAAALVLVMGAAYFLGRGLDETRRHEEHASAIRLVKQGRSKEALEQSDRLLLLNPADPVHRAVHESVALSAAAERLAVAVDQLRADPEAAREELEIARRLLPADGPLVDLVERFRAQAALDPVVRDLEDRRIEVRIAALRRLADALGRGRRPASDALLAVPLALDNDSSVRQLALSVCALLESSDLLVDALELHMKVTPLALDDQTFEALYQTLVAIRDDRARELFGRWDLASLEQLDALRPGEVLSLPPRLEVTADRRKNTTFAAAWVRLAATDDPDALLAEVPRLREQPALIPVLVEAMETLGGPSAVEILLDVAKRDYLVGGVQALEALTRLEALPAILEILHSSLPLELRVKALELSGDELALRARPELATLVEMNPDPDLRHHAFSLLIRYPGTECWDPTATLRSAIDEFDLQERALLWLERLEEPRRYNLSLQLLSHSSQVVRARAAQLLASAGPEWLPRVALRLFSRDASARRGAVATLLSAQNLQRGEEEAVRAFATVHRALREEATHAQSAFRLMVERARTLVAKLRDEVEQSVNED